MQVYIVGIRCKSRIGDRPESMNGIRRSAGLYSNYAVVYGIHILQCHMDQTPMPGCWTIKLAEPRRVYNL